MMSSMLGLASGARFRHLRMRARSVRFFTMATCSSRLSGSGSFRVQISQRRTPKLYTSTYARKQNYSFKKKFIVHLRSLSMAAKRFKFDIIVLATLRLFMSNLVRHVGMVPRCWPIERAQSSSTVGHSKSKRYRLDSSQDVEVHFFSLTLFLACFTTSSLKTIDYT